MSPRPLPSLPRSPLLAGLALGLLPGALGGCVSRSERFDDHDAGAVWTALVRAAEEPELADWKTLDNDVWSDERSGRIEIHRVNRRYVYTHDAFPRMETREWDFSVVLEPTDPPTVSFTIRELTVPAWGWLEAEAYFARVWDLLGGRTNGLDEGRRRYREAIEDERASEPRPDRDPDDAGFEQPPPTPEPAVAPAPMPGPPLDLPD